MSKAKAPRKLKPPESPTPSPSPVGRGAVCLAACILVHLSLVYSSLVNYIYNKVETYTKSCFLWICKERSIFIDILSLKICV